MVYDLHSSIHIRIHHFLCRGRRYNCVLLISSTSELAHWLVGVSVALHIKGDGVGVVCGAGMIWVCNLYVGTYLYQFEESKKKRALRFNTMLLDIATL